MLYLTNKNLEYKSANVFDLHKFFYITDLVYTGNVPTYEFNSYEILIFKKPHIEHDYYECCTLDKKLIRNELVLLLKDIDTKPYFKTNYRIFNSEDTNSVFFKAFFVAIAVKYAELNNAELSDIIKLFGTTKYMSGSVNASITGAIYDEYMQAEAAEDIAERFNNNKERLNLV
jgi:hypothetical protein